MKGFMVGLSTIEVKATIESYKPQCQCQQCIDRYGNGKLIWWLGGCPAPIAFEQPTATNFYHLAEIERFRAPAGRLVCDLKTELAKVQ